ncbi:hypothetical protein CGRA01v4_08207 [Colletotrichum graminicola]|nr:hypothetical protein CGRA01v4_08207 [Colletotrichum graminicola]
MSRECFFFILFDPFKFSSMFRLHIGSCGCPSPTTCLCLSVLQLHQLALVTYTTEVRPAI